MEEISNQLNLSEVTQKVYGVILMKGCVTSSTISNYLKIGIEQAEEAINSLKDKNLIKQASGIIPRYIPLPPLKEFSQYLSGYSTKIGDSIKKIEDIEKNKTKNYDKISQTALTDMNEKLDFQIKNLQENKSKIIDSTEKTQKSILDNVNQQESKTAEETKKLTQNFLDNVKKQFENLKTSENSKISVQKKNLETTLQEIPQSLENQYNEIVSSKITDINSLKNQIEKENGQLIFTIKDDLSKNLQAVGFAIDNIKEKNYDFLNSTENEIKSSLNKANSVLKSNFESSTSQITQNFNSIKDQLTSFITSFNQNFQTQADSLNSNSISTVETLNNEIGSLIVNLQQSIIDNTKKQYEDTTTQLKNHHDTMKKAFESQFDANINSISSYLDDMKINISNSVENIEKSFNDGNQILLNSLQEYFKAQISNLSDLKISNETKFNQLADTLTVQFKDSMEKIKQNIVSEYHDQHSQLLSFNEKFESEVSQEINEKSNQLKMETFATRSKFVKDVENVKSIFVQNFTTVKNDGVELIEKENTQFNDDYKLFSESIKTRVENISNNIKEKTKSTSEKANISISEIISSNKASISISTEKNIKDIQTSFESSQLKIKEQIQGKITEIETNLNGIGENFTLKTQELKNKAESEILGEINKANTLNAQNLEIFSKNIEKFNGIIGSSIHNQIESYNLHKTNSTQFIVSQFNLFKSELEKTISAILSQLESISSVDFPSLESQLHDIESHFKEDISNTVKSIKGLIDISEGNPISIFKKIEIVILEAIEKVKISVKESIVSGKQVLDLELGKVFTSALTTMSSVKNLGDEPIEILNKAWDQMISIDAIHAEKAWHLVGMDSIKPYISNMIEESKGKMTIVVPSIDDLPIDLILKKRVRFTIITDVPAGDTDSRVEKLKEKGTTIMAYDGKDFIAVDRDSEEILFAAVDDKSGPVTAVISEIEPMITILGSMIADYWRRVAKKI